MPRSHSLSQDRRFVSPDRTTVPLRQVLPASTGAELRGLTVDVPDVVVVWSSASGPEVLSKCLRALDDQSDDLGSIVVVEQGRRRSLLNRTIRARVADRRPTPGAARNAGASLTSARKLAFVGAGVEVLPGWAAAIGATLDGEAGIAAGVAWASGERQELGDPFGRNGFLPWGSALNLGIRREVLDDLGGFEEGLPALDDAELCFRSQLAGFGFEVAPDARAATPQARGTRASEEARLAQAEALLAWRYRENPYFAARPRGRQRGPVSWYGTAGGWIHLLAQKRPLEDLVVGHESHRYLVMPLVAGPAAIVTIGAGADQRALRARLADHDLSACLPGPDAAALARWDHKPDWSLATTRAAQRAGWRFEPRIAARRLEQSHPRTAGDAFVAMGAVLAWYEGHRGFVLLASEAVAPELAARLPETPLLDLAGGADLDRGLRDLGPRRLGQGHCPPFVVAAAWRRRGAGIAPARIGASPPTSTADRAAIGEIAAGMNRDPLLLVSGCPRSGTTLFRNMLAAHPDLAVPFDEGNFVTRVFGQMKLAHRTDDLAWAWELIKQDRHFRAWELDVDQLEGVIAENPPASYSDLIRVLFAAIAAKEGKPLTADKCTSYSMHWEWLAERFPTTKFVHVVRDPREVCMSLALQYFHHGGVAGAASWWLIHTMGTPKIAAALGDRWLEIRYEDLVSDPTGQLKTVCRHAGIEFDEAMLMYSDAEHKPGGVHRRTDSEAPKGDIRSWRGQLSHDDLVTIERMTGPVMKRFGYEPETKGITLAALDMTTRFLLKEARNQWLLSGAFGPQMVENLLALTWRPEL